MAQPPYQPYQGPPPGQQPWQPQPQPPQPPQQGWPQPPPQQQWQPPPVHQPWPPGAGEPGQPYAPPPLPGAGLGTHVKRAFNWNLAAIVPTPREAERLTAAGIEPRMHGLYVWRRSAMIVALPLLLFSVVLSFVQAAQADHKYSTDFGNMISFLPSVALLFVPLGALIVINSWTNLHGSSRALVVCWLISVAIAVVVALMPFEFVFDRGFARGDLGLTPGDFRLYVLKQRSDQAAYATSLLLPVILSIPSGVLMGAGRIKSLFPAAAMPGWFLVAVGPFYSMFKILVFVAVLQIAGNFLLTVGVGLWAFTPWLFVIHRKVYGQPLSAADARTELPRASRLGAYLTAVAFVLIGIAALSERIEGVHVLGGDADNSFFTYTQVLRIFGEYVGRNLVTAVVFSTIFLYVVYGEWRTTVQMSGELRAEHDAQVRALEKYMTSPAAHPEAGRAPR